MHGEHRTWPDRFGDNLDEQHLPDSAIPRHGCAMPSPGPQSRIDAYAAGHIAGTKGDSADANPFIENLEFILWYWWAMGWEAGVESQKDPWPN